MNKKLLLLPLSLFVVGAAFLIILASQPEPEAASWQEYQWTEYGVRFEMPGVPRRKDEEIVSLPKTKTWAEGLNLVTSNPQARFFVLTYTLKDEPKRVDQALDLICLSVLSQMEGTKPRPRNLKLGDYPGRELKFLYEDDTGIHRRHTRLYRIDGRYFFLCVDMLDKKADDTISKRFLESFEIVKKGGTA